MRSSRWVIVSGCQYKRCKIPIGSVLAYFTLTQWNLLGGRFSSIENSKKLFFKCPDLMPDIMIDQETITCCHAWWKECLDTIWWWDCCKVPRCEVIIPSQWRWHQNAISWCHDTVCHYIVSWCHGCPVLRNSWYIEITWCRNTAELLEPTFRHASKSRCDQQSFLPGTRY